jgi:hypothetical protein
MPYYTTKKFVYQPIVYWPHIVPAVLCPGITVRPAPNILEENSTLVRYSLSDHEIKTMKHSPAWLCCEFRDEAASGTKRQQRAVELVRNTQLAIQIVTNAGLWESTIIVCEERGTRLDVIQIAQKPRMETTIWARMLGVYHSSLSELQCVVRGVNAAFNGSVTRLINPLYLLELGLESTNPHLLIFLWVTALDALLMAGNPENFKERLYNFLDGDSFVFQSLDEFGQPRYLVSDVAQDLYELRSIVAHGREIPKKFTQACGFKDSDGQIILGYEQSYQYREVLQECAFSLLVRALRAVFIEDRTPIVRKTDFWRSRLRFPF